MLENKKFLIIFLLLVVGLSVSMVSASQHDNNILNQNSNPFLTPMNNIDYNGSIGILRSGNLILYYGDTFWAGIIDERLLPVEGENVTFNIDGKTYNEVTNQRGTAYLHIQRDIKPGVYDVKISCRNQTVMSYNNTILGVNVLSSDMTTYPSGGDYFTARIMNTANVPITNMNVNFKLNGKNYDVVTDSNGYASIPVNLKAGEYDVHITCKDVSVTNKIHVLGVNIISSDMSKYSDDDDDFTVKIVNTQDKPVDNIKVNFKLDGKDYSAFSNDEGYASIPVNLNPGEYKITTTCNGVSVTNKILILNNIRIISNDMSKYSDDNDDFTVKIVNTQDKPIANIKVNFKLDGKDYNCLSDDNGYASIPVKLYPGEYKITTTCNGISVINKITIYELIKNMFLDNDLNNTKVCESFT